MTSFGRLSCSSPPGRRTDSRHHISSMRDVLSQLCSWSLAIALSGLCAAPAAAGPIPNPLNGYYTAMGDSFSSGEGAGAYFSDTNIAGTNQCHRSVYSWPSLVAANFGATGSYFRSTACSGAIVADVRYALAVSGEGQWNEGPQIYGSLSDEVKLVTISIGGNDIGFGEILRRCARNATVRHCQHAVQLYTTNGNHGLLQALIDGGWETIYVHRDMVRGPYWCGTRANPVSCRPLKRVHGDHVLVEWDALSLTELYNEIAEGAPNAQIRVLQYPPVFPPNYTDSVLYGNKPCRVFNRNDGSQVGFWTEFRAGSIQAMANGGALLNATIRNAVADTNNPRIVAVDTSAGFANTNGKARWLCNEVFFEPGTGEVLYTYNRDSFFNGLSGFPPSVESFHPNQDGQVAIAAAVNGS